MQKIDCINLKSCINVATECFWGWKYAYGTDEDGKTGEGNPLPRSTHAALVTNGVISNPWKTGVKFRLMVPLGPILFFNRNNGQSYDFWVLINNSIFTSRVTDQR